MASILRCLVLENEVRWQKALKTALETVGGEVEVDVAPGFQEARTLVERRTYDLATVDLSLVGEPRDAKSADELGLRLVEHFRTQERSRDIALLVVTGYSTPQRVRLLLRKHRVFDVIEKADFSVPDFVATARDALLEARVRRASETALAQYLVTLSFGDDRWISSELHGPDRRGFALPEGDPALATARLSREADEIDELLTGDGSGDWRERARSLGREVFAGLMREPGFAAHLAAARELSSGHRPLWLQFSGPAAGLGLPFELMLDGEEYLCFQHLISRRLFQRGLHPVRKTEPFHRFLEGLARRQGTLRVLLVAADSDGEIPAVDQEVSVLAAEIEAEALRLGLSPYVDTLTGGEATYEAVAERLQRGGFHLFHYAGHGRSGDALPERGGLVLGRKPLTATDLRVLVSGTDLRFVFLSCCLGARTAQQPGRGDFHGVLEALARADVPTVLGYRWTLADDRALELAQAFYRSLWQTLSPCHALLEARQTVSRGDSKRDNETWAAPVLLCQTD